MFKINTFKYPIGKQYYILVHFYVSSQFSTQFHLLRIEQTTCRFRTKFFQINKSLMNLFAIVFNQIPKEFSLSTPKKVTQFSKGESSGISIRKCIMIDKSTFESYGAIHTYYFRHILILFVLWKTFKKFVLIKWILTTVEGKIQDNKFAHHSHFSTDTNGFDVNAPLIRWVVTCQFPKQSCSIRHKTSRLVSLTFQAQCRSAG